MAKFKSGDVIVSTIPNHGFDELTVIEIITKKLPKGKTKDCYRCKITNGEALLPVTAESAYKLKNSK